jgi:TPR repeat protein
VPEDNLPASPARNQPDAGLSKNQAAEARPAPRVVPVAGSSSAVVNDPSGAEELATAEKYLNGGPGVTRNSGEAAQWLWKAMSNGNVAATVALADLYLRGDGVPKNCDQAHVLLDAAARKGSAAAAERLRNLQAFGCQ